MLRVLRQGFIRILGYRRPAAVHFPKRVVGTYIGSGTKVTQRRIGGYPLFSLGGVAALSAAKLRVVP